MADDTIELISKGQDYYRAEQYTQAREIFESLLQNKQKDRYVNEFKVELFTNYIASLVMCGDYNAAIEKGNEYAKSNYEIAYNVGCSYLGMGIYKEASDLLKSAASLCRDSMKSKNASKEELDEEITPILVQQLLADMLKGADVAAAMKTQMDDSKNDFSSSVVLATNNVSNKPEADLPESRKKFRSIFHMQDASASFDRLTSTQRISVLAARAFVLMNMNKNDEAKDILNKIKLEAAYHRAPLCMASTECLSNSFIGSPYAVSVVCEAAIQAKLSSVDDAIIICDSFISQIYKQLHDAQKVADVIYVGLALMRLYIMKGDAMKGVNVVMQLAKLTPNINVLYSGAVLCLHAYSTVSDRANALNTLCDTVEQNCSNAKTHEAIHQTRMCLMFMGAWFAHNGNHQRALGMFSKCVQLHRELREFVEQSNLVPDWLAQAYENQDYFGLKYAVQSAKAVGNNAYDEYEGILKEASTNVEPFWLKLYNAFEILASPSSEVATVVQAAKSRKRNRKHKHKKIRLPKDYDPNVVPDPERWLPKRDRSYYKKTLKKKDAALRGSQGMVSAATAASLQVTASATPAAESSTQTKVPPAGIEKYGKRRKH